jgi:hypothetical protein
MSRAGVGNAGSCLPLALALPSLYGLDGVCLGRGGCGCREAIRRKMRADHAAKRLDNEALNNGLPGYPVRVG